MCRVIVKNDFVYLRPSIIILTYHLVGHGLQPAYVHPHKSQFQLFVNIDMSNTWNEMLTDQI